MIIIAAFARLGLFTPKIVVSGVINMHIAIDDTHSSNGPDLSDYVTSRRRTCVAVLFDDSEVEHIRAQLRAGLAEIRNITQARVDEFHFAEIYNKRGAWKGLQDDLNLKIFSCFAYLYQCYRWPVIIQTVDERTIKDLKGLQRKLNFEGLNPYNLGDLSLALLALRIRARLKNSTEPLTIIVDETPLRKPGSPFGKELFRDWATPINGYYASSRTEELLQIADFLAFCINRTTHLSMKTPRTDIDNWFLWLATKMRINSNELIATSTDLSFTVKEFDEWHRQYRRRWGIPD